MDDQKTSAQLRYLEELALRLRREGFQAVQTEGGEMLHISQDDVYLCRVSGEGTVNASFLLWRRETIKRPTPNYE